MTPNVDTQYNKRRGKSPGLAKRSCTVQRVAARVQQNAGAARAGHHQQSRPRRALLTKRGSVAVQFKGGPVVGGRVLSGGVRADSEHGVSQGLVPPASGFQRLVELHH